MDWCSLRWRYWMTLCCLMINLIPCSTAISTHTDSNRAKRKIEHHDELLTKSVPQKPQQKENVIYRVNLHMRNLNFSAELAIFGPAFELKSQQLIASLELLFVNCTGEQFVTVTDYRASSTDIGSVVSFDISTRNGYALRTELRTALETALSRHQIGPYEVSDADFKFYQINGFVAACTEWEFSCRDRSCIPISAQCNGVVECEDASDESDEFAYCHTRKPVLLSLSKDVQATEGATVELIARVRSLGNNRLSWIKHPGNQVLAANGHKRTKDARIRVKDAVDVGEYFLIIEKSTETDSGVYELRIEKAASNTSEPIISEDIEVHVLDTTTDVPESDNRYELLPPVPEPDQKVIPVKLDSGGECQSDEFRCDDDKCIPAKQRCDTYRDCADKSDEKNCSDCGDGRFLCDLDLCLDLIKKCDGTPDCADGSDEVKCPKCSSHDFICDNRCLPNVLRCDGERDCSDASDEANCPSAKAPITAAFLSRCPDGSSPELSLHGSAYCWHNNVCPLGTRCIDGNCCKTQYGNLQRCAPWQYECRDGRCIDARNRCNRHYDCEDGSDEMNCGDYVHARNSLGDNSRRRHRQCRPRVEFGCADGRACIDIRRRCDRRADCQDGSDEHNCNHTDRLTTRRPTQQRCRQSEYRCGDGQCIAGGKRCDRHYDCKDGSDETTCDYFRRPTTDRRVEKPGGGGSLELPTDAPPEIATVTPPSSAPTSTSPPPSGLEFSIGEQGLRCAGHQYLCRIDARCIDRRRLCDGRPDCTDGADERCNEHGKHYTAHVEEDRSNREGSSIVTLECTTDQMLCAVDKTCIDLRRRCDGRNDCSRGEDERDCGSDDRNHRRQHPQCDPVRQFRCLDDHRCVDVRRRCDGRADCADGSDEASCMAPPLVVNRARPPPRTSPTITPTPRTTATETDIHYHGGAKEDGFNLDVYPTEKTVREGEQVSFDCRSRDPRAQLRWTRVGGPLPGNAQVQNGRLVINDVRQSDSGRYVCVANVDERTVEGFTMLTVREFGPALEQRGSGRCIADERQCRNGDCVKSDYMCDGEYDCVDRSDEDGCPEPRACEPNEFKCDNRRCVQKMWLCDGDDDCGDQSDERNCGTRGPSDRCNPIEFSCRDDRQCVPNSFVCDQQNDCFDGSDEVGCAEPSVVEGPPSSKTVVVSTTMVLKCHAVGFPVPYINWRLNWGPVCGPPRCTQTSENGYGVLTITDIRTTDQGAYTCEAINVKGRILYQPDCIVTVIPGTGGGDCSPYGSISTSRDRNGRCQCKENTMGDRCDQCKPKSFYLHQNALYGCLPCFCSGITQDCQSSSWYRSEVSSSFSQGAQNTAIVDFQEREVDERPNFELGRPERGWITVNQLGYGTAKYFSLKGEFVGDKVTAYGGKIRYQIQYSGSGQPTSDPMLVLKGNEIVLVHRPQDQARSDQKYQGAVMLYENFWTREDGQPATREHLLMTLADLDSFLIKATHVSGQTSCALGPVSMQIAVNRDTQQERALAVEECRCPPGYIGLSCQDCAPGYERSGGGLYLGTCEQIIDQGNCNTAGSVSTRPGPGGRCQCKSRYVTGPLCDRCVSHAFFLAPENPSGCIPCFCSGLVDTCQSSNLHRTQERLTFTSGGRPTIRLRTSDYREPQRPQSLPTVEGNMLVFTGFNEVFSRAALYFELPEQFRGDKVTSYGGKISATFKFSGSGPMTDDPLFVLRGNDITLLYRHVGRLDPDRENTVEVKFFENVWQREDGQQATREHMIMALADVDDIMVKAGFMENTQRAELISVTMDYAVEQQTGQARASAVEECQCPPGYTGYSCEDCDAGYARTGGGLYLGLCEACECHGHATDCDVEYGFCIDCQHNTEGDRCERCKPGHTGDARRGTPQDCPPDEPPINEVKCQCFNHSPRGCDKYGRCLFCEHNTEGEQCDRCKDGFYGDATRGTAFDCTPCPCPGARECFLDTDGLVTCRGCPAGFTGRNCESCAPGYTVDTRDPARRCRPIEFQVQIVPPTTVDVQAGATIQWRCIVRNNYQDAYTLAWTRPGHERLPANARDDGDGLLTLSNVGEADSGHYQCMGSTKGHVSSDDATLNVKRTGGGGVSGVPPQVRIEPMNVWTAQPGESYTFYCRLISGDPSHTTIRWEHKYPLPDNAYDKGSGQLVFTNVQADNQGRYVCFAENAYGSGRDELQVVVNADERGTPPRLTVTPALTTVVAGEPATFTCTATGTPPPVITWGFKVPAGPLRPNLDQHAGVLTISSVRLSDAGQYFCTASNIEGTESVPVSLYVNAQDIGPQIRIDPTTTWDANVGEQKEFTCVVLAGSPPPTVTWKMEDGSDLPPNFAADDNVLIVTDAQFSDSGKKCKCSAVNRVGVAEDILTINVGPSLYVRIIPDVQVYNILEGERLDLVCEATGDPSPTVEWIFDKPPERGDKPDNYKAPVIEGRRIVHDAVTQANSGEYKCVARQNDLSKTDVILVNVQPRGNYKLTVLGGNNQYFGAGTRVELRCLAFGPLSGNVRWTRKGASLPAHSNEDQPGVLVIDPFEEFDAGKYECLVYGTSEADIVATTAVHVSVRPGPASGWVTVDGPMVRVVEQGDSIALKCNAPDSEEDAYEYTWTVVHADGSNTQLSRGDGDELQIEGISGGDHGVYQCTVTDADGVALGHHAIAVVVNLVNEKASKVGGEVGLDLNLECPVLNVPGSKVTWSRDRGDLPPSAVQEGHLLRITDFEPNDAGTYKCTVQINADNAYGYVHAEVFEPGEILRVMVLSEGGEYAKAGDDVTLNCVVEGDNAAVITWEKRGGVLPDNAEVIGNKLVFRGVQQSDQGHYVCKANTRVGPLFADGILSVDVGKRRQRHLAAVSSAGSRRHHRQRMPLSRQERQRRRQQRRERRLLRQKQARERLVKEEAEGKKKKSIFGEWFSSSS